VPAVEAVRSRLEARGITVALDVPRDLPRVRADRNQIERMLANLLDNAERATPVGGTITVSATRRGSSVAVSVADTGRGIPAEYLPRIFGRFVRVPNSDGRGAGLGLAIARGIVEAHGGQIVVQSEQGHGTTFTFTIPTDEAPAGAVDIASRVRK
jgi:signal transduction histidine kinase